MPQLDRLHQ